MLTIRSIMYIDGSFCQIMLNGETFMDTKISPIYSDVYIFVDESGSITKKINRNKYFVICMVFTKDKIKLNRAFRKENIRLAKKYPKLGKMLSDNKEIKGKDITERRKNELYKNMVEKYGDLFELGVIVLDNRYTSTQLSLEKARCFNFLIQEYMSHYFRNHCRFFDRKNTICENINFTIDERNVKTNAKHKLDGYLTSHLKAFDPICTKTINVAYTDSKNVALVQFADYIANTFLRNMKRIKSSCQNVSLLQNNLCDKRIFVFPVGYDIYMKTEI